MDALAPTTGALAADSLAGAALAPTTSVLFADALAPTTSVLALLVAQNVAFYVIAAIMLFAGFRVVTSPNVVHAALYLIAVLAGVAALFLLLGAEFVGITQVLIYIGAVIVLFLFGIMLTRSPMGADTEVDHPRRLPATLAAALVGAVTIYSVLDYFGDEQFPKETRTTTNEVADSIFSDYIIAFEAVSVLLLAALIGAIVVARRD